MRKPLALSLLLALRPKQWIKNLLLFAGLLFTLNEKHPPDAWMQVFLGFVLFCLLSGCTYLFNDLRDREADCQHPVKKSRPIASGDLPVPVAAGFALVVTPLTLLGGWFLLGGPFTFAAIGYAMVTLLYSLFLKHLVLIDVFTLAAGFVLRAVAGSVAVPVVPSEWLLLCTFLLALFIGLNKRRSEIVALGDAPPTRRILAEYSIGFLDQMITLVATTCVVSYLLYSFLSPTGRAHPYLMGTAPFVLYGIFRYLYLAQAKGKGEAPETVLLTDRPMAINLLLWLVAVAFALLQ
ncbi:MAG: decaprenyl-phosphate phosphoribosyltransferase [Armatimonadaceae bacterium]